MISTEDKAKAVDNAFGIVAATTDERTSEAINRTLKEVGVASKARFFDMIVEFNRQREPKVGSAL